MAEMVARAKELAAGATGNPDLHYDTLLTELQEALDTAEAYEAENTALRMTLKRLASENAYLRADNKTCKSARTAAPGTRAKSLLCCTA